MSRVYGLSDEEILSNKIFQQGYHDGYTRELPARSDEQYLAGWNAGSQDKTEDELALATGDFDGLSEAERELIYGNEHDRA